MNEPEFPDAAVKEAFDAVPARAREGLLALRTLIFEAAGATQSAGRVEETLKWGQPAYLTPDTKSGSTIRLGVPKSPEYDYALFVHCQSDLTRQFETNYPGEFEFEGTRAVLFRADKPIPADALRHCIAMALTYHSRK
ncbi:DUF1801 domain-containing protein [Mesorhizobium sp. Z1-4]|uniref:DUF1801 domain-containing protein n=1 Tax=Mesorhizobium sp. Z1-4 TaxID=2448478 RepID=UPI000FD81605|nr:DUF1801 domain-containing protein [Mesorhizobium sp. Z1-4]